ncbi:MAG: hypothetical protein KKH70_10865 [Gammaproteobacteria bacterium]|nr:hypothetical protein [Gammaproteobacteria bacterium]MBU2343242.1 hypothetical protein [Gammaproteobacteria bacterium]MBU2393828.1 hypothetical protein [Gammaproteobacteria bacterium]MBU2682210.1 hypothetical protein [Gammaproteobacteria bacterium]
MPKGDWKPSINWATPSTLVFKSGFAVAKNAFASALRFGVSIYLQGLKGRYVSLCIVLYFGWVT